MIEILESIPNSFKNRKYLITHLIPEVTFEGNDKKPDFGKVTIKYIANDKLIELKSLKYYFYQYRNKIYSYERFINTIYDDLKNVYSPYYLCVTLETNPRGGISSILEVKDE